MHITQSKNIAIDHQNTHSWSMKCDVYQNMKCNAYAHNAKWKCKSPWHTQLKLGTMMGNVYTYNAKWKHTQCNYVDTKHKPTKFSKGNAKAIQKADALSQNTNIIGLQR
jgi:hypothetical protein